MKNRFLICLFIEQTNSAYLNMTKSSLLLKAASNGKVAKVRRLLAKGADVDHADSYGMTALSWAAITSRVDIAMLLLERGAKVNGPNSNGITALMYAAINNSRNVAELLLERGADPDNQLPTNDYSPEIQQVFAEARTARLALQQGRLIKAAQGPAT